jgi:hypothetical protein
MSTVSQKFSQVKGHEGGAESQPQPATLRPVGTSTAAPLPNLAWLAADVDKATGDESNYDVRTRSVRRRARASMRAEVTAGMSLLSSAETLAIHRDRNMSVRLAWATFAFGSFFTGINVAFFALQFLPQNLLGQVTAWVLDPLVLALVLAVVRTEIRMRRQGLRVYRIFQFAKWAGLLATYAMNAVLPWTVLANAPTGANLASVVIHSVPPLMAFAAAEVLPRMEEAMTQAQSMWLKRHVAVSVLDDEAVPQPVVAQAAEVAPVDLPVPFELTEQGFQALDTTADKLADDEHQADELGVDEHQADEQDETEQVPALAPELAGMNKAAAVRHAFQQIGREDVPAALQYLAERGLLMDRSYGYDVQRRLEARRASLKSNVVELSSASGGDLR